VADLAEGVVLDFSDEERIQLESRVASNQPFVFDEKQIERQSVILGGLVIVLEGKNLP
jgi:hypothetical protein